MPHISSNTFLNFFAIISAVASLLGGLWFVLTRSYRAVRKIDDTFDFVDNMRSNHLPHLYSAIKAIARHLEIDIPDEPEEKVK